MAGSEFGLGEHFGFEEADANGWPVLDDPTGVRDVQSIYASDTDDPADDGTDWKKVGRADGIGSR